MLVAVCRVSALSGLYRVCCGETKGVGGGPGRQPAAGQKLHEILASCSALFAL